MTLPINLLLQIAEHSIIRQQSMKTEAMKPSLGLTGQYHRQLPFTKLSLQNPLKTLAQLDSGR